MKEKKEANRLSSAVAMATSPLFIYLKKQTRETKKRHALEDIPVVGSHRFLKL